MPYTPPAPQSPSSSKSTSPSMSRSSSVSEDVPRSPVTGRPLLPRSHSAASYMHRHRRSPSITKADAPPTPTEGLDDSVQATDFAQRGTVRQSPPPVNNLLIPTGAILSPPDSSENSDGDEGQQRGRELEIRKLQEAVRSIDQRRESSPSKKDGITLVQTTESEPVSRIISPTALSAEARKISHSRSSTETAIIIPRAARFSMSPAATSDDSDDDEDAPLSKPSLVRKKSGELVKPALRPSSRRRYSSMPGTPTYGKSVHFNDNDNQTRHFLQVDKPMAVSAGSSPVETYDSETEYPFDKTEREIKLVNFPAESFERSIKPIRVERIFLSADQQTLVGSVAVQNLSFHKLVVVRFTLDYWKTTSEVVAEYNNDVRNPTTDGCDRFNFHIKLSDQANVDNKTLLLCVRYNVNGQEFWDNNDNQNYHIDFTKSTKRVKKPTESSPLGTRPLSAIPRSRHSPPTTSHGRSRQDSRDDHDDEFGRHDTASAYHFGSSEPLYDEPSSTIKLKPKTKQRSNPFSMGQTHSHNNLGGRYDFTASLSAALSTAQDKLGRNSGLMNGTANKGNGSYFGPQERKAVAVAAPNDKPEVNSDRPPIGSDQYRDLVQKFCYFTPTGTGKASTSPQASRSVSTVSLDSQATKSDTPQADGADDQGSSSSSSSGRSSPATSPSEIKNDQTSSSTPSIVISRSGSPALTSQDYTHRVASPASFGYPYHNKADGYFEAPHYTVIRG